MSDLTVSAQRKLDRLAAGDVVALRSGGPRMTVVSVSNDQAECAWFVQGELVKKTVPVATLRYLDLVGTISRWFSSD